MMDTRQLWDGALSEVGKEISPAAFSTWFKGTHILKVDDGTVVVGVPNEFIRDWLLNKYHKLILKNLRATSEAVRGVEYAVVGDKKQVEVRSVVFTPPNELPLDQYYINPEDNLNPRYSFASLVVGSFNELAHAAAQAVIQKPGVWYNPLYIHGNTGHGKTHIIQAVGNHLKASGKKVFYITSERFATELINAMQANTINKIKEKYRRYDVLIMDDVQFFSGKEKSQEELFHLFNALFDSNKQILFSSDRHPNSIQNLAERLRSRFSAGMVVDISAPDYESRLAIVKKKALLGGFPLNDATAAYLAETIDGNIRELEGALNSVVCQTQLKNRELSIAEVKNIIKTIERPKKNVPIKEVVKLVAGFYNLEEHSIYEKSRRKEVVKPRQMIMYLLREDFGISFPTIGEKLGGRDHTTVIHSCEKIRNELKNNNVLVAEMAQLRTLF
jgi:chromosomal replication initiator protein